MYALEMILDWFVVIYRIDRRLILSLHRQSLNVGMIGAIYEL